MTTRAVAALFAIGITIGSAAALSGEGGPWRAEALGEGGQQPSPAGARPPGRPQPAVDPLTASIVGRVTSADTGAPIRRAEVRAIANSGVSRLSTTDGDGRFELRDMPAGQFRLTFSKSGFVPLTFGQRRPFEAVTPIDLKQGQQFTANIALPRGGAIAGRVYDDGGEPIADVRVQALRSRITDGRRRLEPVGPVDITDDTGAYRLYGFPPGDYYVAVSSSTRRQLPLQMTAAGGANAARADVRSTMTTFYPGTPSLEEAQRVALGAGGEARADVQIGLARAAIVSGIVLTSSGAPATYATVTLRSEVVVMGVSALVAGPPPLMITGHTNPDGTFTLPNVPPGPYTLQAVIQDAAMDALAAFKSSGKPPVMPPAMPEMAVVPLVVTGPDVTGLTLNAGAAGTLEGAFVADAGVTQPLPTGLEVDLRSLTSSDPSMRMTGANRTFQIAGFSGSAYLAINGLPDDWAVKAVLVDGVDVTDQPIDFRSGRHMTARLVLTDRVTMLAGVVTSGAAVATDRRNKSVIVFADDPKKWTYPTRYVRTARTDEQGTFRISGLPPDERYLAVAVDHLEDGEASDPEFLEGMRSRATSVSLGEAERRNIELRLIQRGG